MSNIHELINSLEEMVNQIENIINKTGSEEIDRDRGINSKSQKEFEKYLDGLANNLREVIIHLRMQLEGKETKPTQMKDFRGKGHI